MAGYSEGSLSFYVNFLPRANTVRSIRTCSKSYAAGLLLCRIKDGFWHASLLDPASYPSPETSCSGFFVYALAYGINEGLLPKEEFMPVVEKGWQALVSAVGEDGKLGYVQPIGADPKKVTPDMTEVYGPGAFLMAGTEVYRMAQDTPRQHVNIPKAVSVRLLQCCPINRKE